MIHLGGLKRYSLQVFEEDLPKWAGKGRKEFGDDEIDFCTDLFLEVVNKDGETIGLFFLLHRLTDKPDCRDGLDFAHYYDQLITGNDDWFWLTEESDWEYKKGLYKTSDVEVVKSIEMNEGWIDLDNKYLLKTTKALISYGRIKYPYGLEEPAKDVYETELNSFNIDLSLYDEPFCEIVDFLIEMFGIDELNKIGCHQRISDLGLDYYGENAEWLLTNTNIDFFIEAAIRNEETDVLAFLLDYKNNHFPEMRNYVPKLQG